MYWDFIISIYRVSVICKQPISNTAWSSRAGGDTPSSHRICGTCTCQKQRAKLRRVSCLVLVASKFRTSENTIKKLEKDHWSRYTAILFGKSCARPSKAYPALNPISFPGGRYADFCVYRTQHMRLLHHPIYPRVFRWVFAVISGPFFCTLRLNPPLNTSFSHPLWLCLSLSYGRLFAFAFMDDQRSTRKIVLMVPLKPCASGRFWPFAGVPSYGRRQQFLRSRRATLLPVKFSGNFKLPRPALRYPFDQYRHPCSVPHSRS